MLHAVYIKIPLFDAFIAVLGPTFRIYGSETLITGLHRLHLADT